MVRVLLHHHPAFRLSCGWVQVGPGHRTMWCFFVPKSSQILRRPRWYSRVPLRPEWRTAKLRSIQWWNAHEDGMGKPTFSRCFWCGHARSAQHWRARSAACSTSPERRASSKSAADSRTPPGVAEAESFATWSACTRWSSTGKRSDVKESSLQFAEPSEKQSQPPQPLGPQTAREAADFGQRHGCAWRFGHPARQCWRWLAGVECLLLPHPWEGTVRAWQFQVEAKDWGGVAKAIRTGQGQARDGIQVFAGAYQGWSQPSWWQGLPDAWWNQACSAWQSHTHIYICTYTHTCVKFHCCHSGLQCIAAHDMPLTGKSALPRGMVSWRSGVRMWATGRESFWSMTRRPYCT